ncbi:MAG: TIGR03619 family F420-dependent LLM class oxidoreductase [Polyangiales bacterium]
MQFWLNLGFIREIEQLPELAAAAEAAGFEGVAVADRYVMPMNIETKYPYTPDGKMFWPKDMPFPDPFVAIAAMAARTKRIRLVSNIYLMALDDPFRAARAVATASVMSGGRVVCGVSSGWLKEEFDIAGLDFASRGRRLDESLAVAKKLWTGKPVSHEGEFFRFPEVVLSPAPRAPIPIFAGGGSRPAMRRVANGCDGWLGLWYTPDKAIEAVKELLALRAQGPRAGEPIEALIGLVGKPNAETLKPLEDAGITGIIATPWGMEDPRMAPLEAKLAAIKGYAERFLPKAP